MSGADVTVEQHGDHVGVVCMHRPPNNYFDTALLEEVATAYEELDRSGWCRADRAGVGGAALLRRPRLRRQRRAGHRRALPGRAPPLRRPAPGGGRGAGSGHRRRLRAGAVGGLPGGDRAEPLQRELRAAGLPPRLRPLRDAARRGGPAGGGRPAADRAARRRRRGAGPRPVRPPRRRRRRDGRRRSATRASWRRRGRWRSAPSGRRCVAAWSRRPGWPWSTSAPSRCACATAPTSPRGCAPPPSGATATLQRVLSERGRDAASTPERR